MLLRNILFLDLWKCGFNQTILWFYCLILPIRNFLLEKDNPTWKKIIIACNNYIRYKQRANIFQIYASKLSSNQTDMLTKILWNICKVLQSFQTRRLGFSSLLPLCFYLVQIRVFVVLFLEWFGTRWALKFSQVYLCQHFVTRAIVTLNV